MNFNKVKKIIQENHYEFIHVESTPSTMINVKNFLKTENKNCIVLSDQQTAGKGRRGNSWYSPKGNIYFSISFNNLLNLKSHFLFSILTAVSIKMTLEKFKAKNIKFKWPNDIFFENKKFSGIILESFKVSDDNSFMIVGCGINIESCPKVLQFSTTYVKKFCKIETLEEFLVVFYEILFFNWKLLIKNNYNNLVTFYTKSLMFIGEKITIKMDNNSSISGIFKRVNTDGSLQIENDNRISNLYNGTIQI